MSSRCKIACNRLFIELDADAAAHDVRWTLVMRRPKRSEDSRIIGRAKLSRWQLGASEFLQRLYEKQRLARAFADPRFA